MNHPNEWIKLRSQIFNLRKSISNNMLELQFFTTQENQYMIDKIDALIHSQRSQLKILEAKIKTMQKPDDEE